MFVPREGNAPSLTAKFTADCSICQLSVAVVASYATLMNRWRESNPLMC